MSDNDQVGRLLSCVARWCSNCGVRGRVPLTGISPFEEDVRSGCSCLDRHTEEEEDEEDDDDDDDDGEHDHVCMRTHFVADSSTWRSGRVDDSATPNVPDARLRQMGPRFDQRIVANIRELFWMAFDGEGGVGEGEGGEDERGGEGTSERGVGNSGNSGETAMGPVLTSCFHCTGAGYCSATCYTEHKSTHLGFAGRCLFHSPTSLQIVHFPPGRQTIVAYDDGENRCSVRVVFPIDSRMEPDAVEAARILLELRLHAVLRGEMSKTYTVSVVTLDVRTQPFEQLFHFGNARTVIEFKCSPEDEEVMVRATTDIVAGMGRGGAQQRTPAMWAAQARVYFSAELEQTFRDMCLQTDLWDGGDGGDGGGEGGEGGEGGDQQQGRATALEVETMNALQGRSDERQQQGVLGGVTAQEGDTVESTKRRMQLAMLTPEEAAWAVNRIAPISTYIVHISRPRQQGQQGWQGRQGHRQGREQGREQGRRRGQGQGQDNAVSSVWVAAAMALGTGAVVTVGFALARWRRAS